MNGVEGKVITHKGTGVPTSGCAKSGYASESMPQDMMKFPRVYPISDNAVF